MRKIPMKMKKGTNGELSIRRRRAHRGDPESCQCCGVRMKDPYHDAGQRIIGRRVATRDLFVMTYGTGNPSVSVGGWCRECLTDLRNMITAVLS